MKLEELSTDRLWEEKRKIEVELSKRHKTKKDEKLKSCPFCGGEATIDKTTHGSRTDIMYTNWRVRCKSCGANIEKSADNSCGRRAYTEDEVIAIWNERLEDYPWVKEENDVQAM